MLEVGLACVGAVRQVSELTDHLRENAKDFPLVPRGLRRVHGEYFHAGKHGVQPYVFVAVGQVTVIDEQCGEGTQARMFRAVRFDGIVRQGLDNIFEPHDQVILRA